MTTYRHVNDTYIFLCEARGCDAVVPDYDSVEYAERERIIYAYADLIQHATDYYKTRYGEEYRLESFCVPCTKRVLAKWEQERQQDLLDIVQSRSPAQYERTGFTKELFHLALRLQRRRRTVCRVVLSALHPRFVHADHCHTTGVPRGVLCADCNIAAGRMKDKPDVCRALAKYLEHFPLELI